VSIMNEIHAALTCLPTRLFHQGEGQFVPCAFISMKHRVCFSFHVIHERVSRWLKPSTTSLLLGTFVEVVSPSWFLHWWVFFTRVLLPFPKWPLRFRSGRRSKLRHSHEGDNTLLRHVDHHVLESAMSRAPGLWYSCPGQFRQLLINGMQQDHSWASAGQHSLNIYEYIRHK
jgi:hypothetical protein